MRKHYLIFGLLVLLSVIFLTGCGGNGGGNGGGSPMITFRLPETTKNWARNKEASSEYLKGKK